MQLYFQTQIQLSHIDFNNLPGFLNERFAMRSAFQDRGGRIYFGGDNGVVMFHPDNIEHRIFNPPVVLLEFRLFNKPIRPGKKDSEEFTLPRNISLLDTIHLNY